MHGFFPLSKALSIILFIVLTACNDEQGGKPRSAPAFDIQQLDKYLKPEREEKVSPTLITQSEGQLEFKLSLDGAESDRHELTRFAGIRQTESVKMLESKVYIRTAINENATLRVAVQLAYQPRKPVENDRNLILVSNQFVDKGSGFRWFGSVTGCQNDDCTIAFKRRKPLQSEANEINRVARKEPHKIAIFWDEDRYAMVFRLNEAKALIDMKPFVEKTGFDPENFRYARLIVGVGNINGDESKGELLVRFEKVYVNGALYDDFGEEMLSMEKWITGQY